MCVVDGTALVLSASSLNDIFLYYATLLVLPQECQSYAFVLLQFVFCRYGRDKCAFSREANAMGVKFIVLHNTFAVNFKQKSNQKSIFSYPLVCLGLSPPTLMLAINFFGFVTPPQYQYFETI